MSRTWGKYINKNKYSECALITALNAYYYLNGKQYCKQDSQEYENLVDLVFARSGAAIGIKKAYDKLGIEIVWQGISLYDFNGKVPLPMGFSVWSKGYGFHSTLMVDYAKKPDCYRITNLKRETNSQGWMFAEDMYKYECFCFTRDYELYSLFGLIGDKKNANLKREWKKNRKEFFNAYRKRYNRICKALKP